MDKGKEIKWGCSSGPNFDSVCLNCEKLTEVFWNEFNIHQSMIVSLLRSATIYFRQARPQYHHIAANAAVSFCFVKSRQDHGRADLTYYPLLLLTFLS